MSILSHQERNVLLKVLLNREKYPKKIGVIEIDKGLKIKGQREANFVISNILGLCGIGV